jgi:ribosome-associated heat shock protein Hsp15
MTEVVASTRPASAGERLRLDKWLWYARFLKTRSLATDACCSGKIRVNGTLVAKAHYPLKPGDVLTFPLGTHIRVVRVLNLGVRRGPASEAKLLYEDLSPPPEPRAAAVTGEEGRPPGSGRPTKAERRALDRLRGGS